MLCIGILIPVCQLHVLKMLPTSWLLDNLMLCFEILVLHFIQVPDMKEIILIGSYQNNDQLNRFINNVQQEFKIIVRYVHHTYNTPV